MKPVNISNLTDMAEIVLSKMLAPSRTSDGDGVSFVQIHGPQTCLEMRLRWDVPVYFKEPAKFLEDLKLLLEPISKAITYGEVVDLREKVKALEKELEARSQIIATLQRYRDATEIMRGNSL